MHKLHMLMHSVTGKSGGEWEGEREGGFSLGVVVLYLLPAAPPSLGKARCVLLLLSA